MKTQMIEAVSSAGNWGKFAISVWDDADWERRSVVDGRVLLQSVGWSRSEFVIITDLQTGEGGVFRLGGLARADLKKKAVWVCPLFEPTLEWLYESWQGRPTGQQLDVWLEALPQEIALDGVPLALRAPRNPGREDTEKDGFDLSKL